MFTTRFGLPRLRVGLVCLLSLAIASAAGADPPTRKNVPQRAVPQPAVLSGQAVQAQTAGPAGPAATNDIAAGPTVKCDLDRLAENIEQVIDGKCMGWQLAIFHDAKLAKELHGGLARNSADSPARSMSASDRLELASCSKTLNAMTTIKALASKGKTVEEKILPYLPASWAKGAGVEGLTFAHLMSHTSGLPAAESVNYDPGTVNEPVKNALAAGVVNPQSPAKYNNINFDMLRVAVPYLVDGASMQAAEGDEAEHELALANCFAGLARQHVFQPAGIGTQVYLSDWHPSGDGYDYARYYDYSHKSEAGVAAPDRSRQPGRGGWKLSASQLCQVLAAYEAGYVLTPSLKQVMKTKELGIFETTLTEGTYYSHNGAMPGTKGSLSQIMLFPGNVQVALILNSRHNTFTGGTLGEIVRDAWLDACKQPDLVVTTFNATGDAKYEDGKLKVPFFMMVKNQGKAATRLEFFNGVKYGDDIRWSGQMIELTPGSQKGVNGTVSIPDQQKKLAGKKVKLVAWADAWITAADTSLPAYARVKESNEPNNLTKFIEVQAPAAIGGFVAEPVGPKPVIAGVALPGTREPAAREPDTSRPTTKPSGKPSTKPTAKPTGDEDDSSVKPTKPAKPIEPAKPPMRMTAPRRIKVPQ